MSVVIVIFITMKFIELFYLKLLNLIANVGISLTYR